jgi:membrane-bound lytic murein transglycosylase D
MWCRRSHVVPALVVVALIGGAASRAVAGNPFPSPASLRPQVEFWKNIFAVYSKNQVVIHDSEHLDRVYTVLDYRDELASGVSEIVVDIRRRKETESEKARIRTLLLRLHAAGNRTDGLTKEERRIRALFDGESSRQRFARAAEAGRIRDQRGLKERFGEGISISRRYLPEMEAIFREEGVPVGLTRLPLVESCFDLTAYSKVGAAGIWQFMPATGRRYMQIGGVVDERRDPIRATRGAARYLKQNERLLGSWPLAITAYNHGEGGVLRAVRQTGTSDIGRIVREYRGPRFGFASRNFYAEFVAALEVERDHRTHFGELTFEAPVRTDEVRLGHAVAGKVAAQCAGASTVELAVLNPAVDGAVFHRNGNIPAGYVLRVPHGGAKAFEQRLAGVPASRRVITPPRAATHRVAGGQTLSHIAHRYGVSVSSLQRANRLRGTTIRVGQVLSIPSSGGRAARPQAVARTHKVQHGQTLSHLARRYRVSVRDIQRVNELRGTRVRAGQVLAIPAS